MAETVKVEVKYGNKILKDVEINMNEHPDVFRAKLYSLTQVPPQNQKLMGLRPALGDSWEPFKGKLKNGQKIMMTGTAEQVAAPTQATVFVEDLPPEQQVVAAYPPGLSNLGNTCYMNASLQCLFSIPELKEAVDKFQAKDSSDQSALATEARSVWKSLAETKGTVEPFKFLLLFRSIYTRFAEQKNGHYSQQDADEFWQTFLQVLAKLPRLEGQGRENLEGDNIVDQLFRGEMEEEYTRADDENDKIKKSVTFTKLSCNIDGSIKHLSESLALTMKESGVELLSPITGTQCLYNRTSKLNRLPFYLTLQFVRFFWKKKENIKAKITRTVDFPFTLDLYDYCTPELQAKLLPYRNEDKPDDATTMAVEKQPYVNHHGHYDLWAVLSHRGRSSDGGHYICFVRQSEDEDDWLEFDDDKVTNRNADDIKKLSGSGGVDWHIAYLVSILVRRVLTS